MVLANLAMQGVAHDFQTGNLWYNVISSEPPRVSVAGHTDGTSAQGELVIPETVEHEGIVYTVTEIGREAFSECNGLTGSLILPNTIDTIRNGAFRRCGGFVGDLVLPNSVRFIGGLAFMDCYGLDGSLSLPNSLSVINYGTFRGCSFSGTLSIPNSVIEICAEAFYGCDGFVGNLVIPNSVVKLNVHSHTINTVLGSFEDCTGFTGLLLSDALEIIDDGNGGGCFAGCYNISGNLMLPESLSYIGASAFWRCTGLSGTLVIPDSVKYIGDYAFAGCTGFKDRLVIPNSVVDIRTYAFSECGFLYLSMGASIETIGAWAFREVPLEKISIAALTPPVLGKEEYGTFPVFKNVSKTIPVYVPCGTEEAYRSAHEWDEFTNYIELLGLRFMAFSDDDALGTVNILKEATCEDRMVQVEALPYEGCEFMYWEANGEQVSSENPYSFELVEDTELVAHFSGAGVSESLSKTSLYPNPTPGQFTISGTYLRQTEVLNTLGQRVAAATGQGETLQIDIAELPTGVYFVSVTDSEGRKCVKKVVKE